MSAVCQLRVSTVSARCQHNVSTVSANGQQCVSSVSALCQHTVSALCQQSRSRPSCIEEMLGHVNCLHCHFLHTSQTTVSAVCQQCVSSVSALCQHAVSALCVSYAGQVKSHSSLAQSSGLTVKGLTDSGPRPRSELQFDYGFYRRENITEE